MARIKGKDLYLKNDDQIYFGNNKEAALWYDNGELQLDHTLSGIAPTMPWHLTTKQYVDDNLVTISGGIVQDHGQLLGLNDDDHTQYLRTDGNRELSNDWDVGDYSITAKEFYGNGATLSGVAYVDGDDVYFYDTTRGKNLGVAIIQVGCGRSSANTTNQYLRTFDGVPMNQTGVPLPFNATLVGASMSGARNDQSWTAQLRINGSATIIASLSINNAYENHTWSANVDLNEGDRVQVYMQGININYPQARLYFRRRK